MYSIVDWKHVFRTLFVGINKMSFIIIATYACLRFGRCCLYCDCSYGARIFSLVYVPHTESLRLTLRHRASYILGQAFRYSPENAFYVFNQQIYFII